MLAEKQKRLLAFIGDYQKAHGYLPSVREVMEFLRVRSTNTAHYHLGRLEADGYLRREPGRARAFALTERAREILRSVGHRFKDATSPASASTSLRRRIPLVGHVTAGALDLAIEDPQGELNLAEYLGADNATFALRVEGESMLGAGIHDGDLVIVRRQSELRERDIGILIIDGETTCKFVHYEPDTIVLRPANEAYSEIRIPRSHPNLEICGCVIGVVRRVRSLLRAASTATTWSCDGKGRHARLCRSGPGSLWQ